MNPKIQTFAQLATNTSGQLTSSYAEWTAFLGTIGRLYKYPYSEQVLIYAQRPEATACASYDVWNKRMGRGVRRGSKGIGLLSADGVRYVFDISDTFGKDGSRKPYLWEYREEHAEAVTAALADKYGVTDEGGLPYQLEAIAQELAGEYWEQNWEDILASVPGSFLEDYDELNVEVEFRNAATVSTTYALMSRCGLNPGEFFTHEDFLPVFDFNTPDSITALGTAVSGNSEQVLRQIEVTIKNYERTRRMERRELYGEQSQLSAGWGLPAARIRGGNTIDFGEIRTDEGAVSEGGAPGAVQPAASQREADGAPDGDRPDGQPEVGASDAVAEKVHGTDGTDEGQRPHEVGGPDEQREGEGGGDDTGRADLPVSAPPAIDFTAVGTTGLQFSHRELNPAVIPYFEDVSEKRELLLKSDALKKRQPEVAEFFAGHTAPDERVQFVKSLFNNTYTEIILDSGQRVGYRAYDDVLHLWRGPYTDREQEEYLRWEDTVSAIEGMMQDGLWMEQEKPFEQINLEIGAPEQDVQDDDYVPNLFDIAGSTIPLTNEPVKGTAPIRLLLPQNAIDAALTLGANDPASRLRIIAEFMKDKPLEENARFLQAHYKENGAGFYVGERKYSLWYNEAGMQIASGESALTFTAAALTWEQAAERIRELLDEGRYASQAMLYRAWPFEKNRIAEALQYLHRDIDEKYKDKYLPTLTAAIGGAYIYPDVVDKTKELLEQPEQLQSVIDEFAVFQKDYAHNRNILRFRHRPDEIMLGLQDLQCTPLKFTALPDYVPVEQFFISQDEIDNLLRDRPDQHDYRIGVYNFFEQHPDRKEREKYLSHLHGEYSGYHGGNDNITYTHKELTFTHGDIIEPYAAVKMKWPQVRKRIEELIKKDAFLSPEDREIMESRTLETPAEELDALETAKALAKRFRHTEWVADSEYADLSRVPLVEAITENEQHSILAFVDLNGFRLILEVDSQMVSSIQYHDLNDLNEHLEKLSAAELIDFAKEQYVIHMKNDAPTKISEQDAKKHDILMANTKAHFASYEEVKQAHPGDIVLFQRGDFFEMYGPDARVASVELDIHLTNRNIPELGRVAMCGVPANSLERYVEILRKEHGVTISVVPENGAERQTYYFSSYKDVPKVSLAPPSSDSLDQASEQNLIATPQMVPSIDEYARIKGQFPGYVVGVQNGDTLYFYGTDAEKAGPALNRNVLIRDIPGMGAVSITGDAESWQASKEKLLGKGIDLTFVRLDETGKYDIIITCTAAEYIPVGMELDIDGRRCRVESVDFQQDAVRLAILNSDLTLTESVRYVREYVEETYDKELEKAAEEEKSRLFVEHVMEDVAQLAEQEPAPTVRELYEHYKEILWDKLMEDEAFQNACLNSDRQNAMDEGHNAVERAAKDLGIAQGDMQFYKLYYGNTPFHNRLNEELATEGYNGYMVLSAELPPWGVEVGNHSPWGIVQTTHELAEGVFKVSTPSHGGIMVRETPAKEYLSPELLARGGTENGWCFFEEDELAPQVIDELTHKGLGPNRETSLRDSITSPSKQEENRPGQTRPERNYRSFTRLFPEIADGSYHYLRMESGSGIGGMMPLHVEWISADTVSISHTYTQNGDLMHDPEMTFLIDRDKGTMEAASYQQDSLGIYQNVYPEPGRWVPELRKDLNNFTQQWLKNISEQNYVKREAIVVENGEDVTLEFDSGGTLIQPKQSPDEPRDPLAPAYKVGDTVFLDETAFTITEIGLNNVQLQDPTLLYPVFRSENKETFEKLLRRDERNLFITDYLTYTRNGPIDDGGDLRDALSSEGGLLNEQSKNQVSEWLRSGEGNAVIAQHLQEKFDGTNETMTLETGETAEFSIYGDRFMLSLMDKSHTVRMYDLWMVAGVLRDMYQRELGGFTHATVPKQYTPQTTRYIVVSDEFGEENRPFTIWDSWNRLHYAEVGDTVNSFGTREEAQTYADTLNSRMYVSKPVAIYPAEKNNLPFDVVVEKLHIEHSERQTEQESTADSKLFPAAQEFSVGDIIQIGKDIPEYRVLYTKKTVLDINSLPVTMYGFSAYWDRELQHLKFIDTATLPSREEIRVIGRANDISVGEKANNRPDKSGNFHITDDNLGAGGAKAKYQMNMAALHTLQKVESENRTATPEEQDILSKYVGWGALADAFDEGKPDWTTEYKELRETLSPEEYESARASTLNAHYTSPTVIKSIYQTLENMGFHGGNILEPSCGVGNFFGLLPDSMSESRLYGVELDGLTGRIAKQLYPNAHIEIKGYENTNFQNNSFDLAIGNVPFGQYKVFDPAYNKLGFSIHNYFFAKAIDQVRPGGIVAFVTSRYTMDSKSTDAREYMAQRAELLGAIRLPNNAFLSNAGTEVVSDILFLQKREQPITELPDWVQTEENKDGYTINSYFVRHPEMILGEQSSDSTQYGRQDFTVKPIPGADLGEQLQEAITHIEGRYVEVETVSLEEEKEQGTVPADPAVKNFSYTIIKGDVYYRQDSVMVKMELGATAKARTTALIDLRDCTRRLIAEQMELSTRDEEIKSTQAELNRLYDNFSRKFGLINDKTNERAFSDDSSYYLLCALEILDDDGKFVRKADMFTKRTILPRQEITHVDTATEALEVSIGERARVDIPFMAGLTGKTEEDIINELQGQIFRVPFREPPLYQTADEYLSGNVREKLKVAEVAAESDPAFNINVNALAAVQPKDLDASEISVRLGTDWIDPEYVEQFMYELLKTPGYAREYIHVQYSSTIHAWNISSKRLIRENDVMAYTTYGTSRVSAYKLLEDALNLQSTKVYDTKEVDGEEKRVLNAKETTLAQQKQDTIKYAFQDWIWKDPERRQKLVRKYNDEMNCIRPRQYDGSHLVLAGMNPEIQLEEHQKNAIARAVYGGNTLFAHCVGAGKTFEITASAMEMKRLGLCSKSMIVVPNHLTGQWASEFLRLYPNANILVTTRRDFEKDRRKKFCSRIATGDYDAVIIGYSQFEKIPISKERQIRQLNQQMDAIVDGVARAKAEDGQRFTVKSMERTKRSLEARLKKLRADNRKDSVIDFEELGIDRLFVDEADNFKNLFLITKMQNVAGLSTSDAQKSSDMFSKTQYLDEITDYKGVIFATGTPISNSITEMFTVQRYLQSNALKAMGMEHFDSWASRFGETTTTMELAPEGTGYRPRERFAKFFNLPELMNIFHEVADIKTEDMLNLPTPDVEFHNIVAKPTEFQKAYVQELSERATAVRIGDVEPTEDNLLKITNDGRKLGLDQRLISPFAEDAPDSKLNLCVDNIMRFWEDGKEDKLTQLVFSDLSTPKKDGTFNVYDDIKRKLVERGVPESEVAFIHDADTEVKKKELFAKVRSGKVRVLIGSTQKLGAGTNVQDRLIALHHLDCPWRPRDLTQREGRIIRRGNNNPFVHVFRYATEGTFDSYLWQTVEKKQQFIGQIMTSKSPARTCEDVDEAALSYAEVKALCAGDPRIKERMELDVEVAKLQIMKASHQSQQYDLEDKIRLYFPQERQRLEWRIEGIERDMATLAEHPLPADSYIGIELLGQYFDERKKAGIVLLNECKQAKVFTSTPVGKYRGLEVLVKKHNLLSEVQIVLKGAVEYTFTASDSDIGNITRIDNALERLPEELAKAQASLENVKQQFESAKQAVGKPFPQEQELKDKLARIAELDIALKMVDEPAAQTGNLIKVEAVSDENYMSI